MIYAHLVIFCLSLLPPTSPPHFNLLLHSCRFSLIHVSLSLFPCCLSHGINNRGLSGCQDNSIGLHRDHMNGNVDWTAVTSRLVIANRNNSGEGSTQPSESRNGTKTEKEKGNIGQKLNWESRWKRKLLYLVSSLQVNAGETEIHAPLKNQKKTKKTKQKTKHIFSFPHQNRHKVVTNQLHVWAC